MSLAAALACTPSASAKFLASRSPSGQGNHLRQHRVDRDSDHDGLANWIELAWTGTNPHKADTDGDGLKDGQEVHRTHTSPLKADTDGDGLSDWTEVKRTKTNPRKANTNGVGARNDVAGLAPGSAGAGQSTPADPGSAGSGPGGPESPPPLARAVWSAPSRATIDVAVTLDGSASSGVGPIDCTWSFENPTGSIVWQTRQGCVIKFTFDESGPKYVRLIVEGADGMSDSNKQTIDVAGTGSDTTAPNTSITASPPASTTETAASFSFTSTETGSTFACKLDSASWASCTSPRTYSSLALGAHSFSVRATDAAGNTDASPATDSWTVQGVAEANLNRSPNPKNPKNRQATSSTSATAAPPRAVRAGAMPAMRSPPPPSAAPPTTSPQGATRAAPTAPPPPGRRRSR